MPFAGWSNLFQRVNTGRAFLHIILITQFFEGCPLLLKFCFSSISRFWLSVNTLTRLIGAINFEILAIGPVHQFWVWVLAPKWERLNFTLEGDFCKIVFPYFFVSGAHFIKVKRRSLNAKRRRFQFPISLHNFWCLRRQKLEFKLTKLAF